MTLLFIGTTELLLIAGVALLLFGGKKVPELMRGLGKGMKSFRQGMSEPLDEETPRKEPVYPKPQAEEEKREEKT